MVRVKRGVCVVAVESFSAHGSVHLAGLSVPLSSMLHTVPAPPKTSQPPSKRRIAFIHPDLGIGGAERLVVDAGKAAACVCWLCLMVVAAHTQGLHSSPRDTTSPCLPPSTTPRAASKRPATARFLCMCEATGTLRQDAIVLMYKLTL